MIESKFYKKQQERDSQLRRRAQEKLEEFKKVTPADLQNAQRIADEYILQCERRRKLSKILVHIDMDAFYANVEIRDNPKLAEKPMAVGSDSMLVTLSSLFLLKLNCILTFMGKIYFKSTSNYVARRFGVRAGMPGFIARELCPELIIVPCNFRKYQSDSKQIM